MLKSHLWIYYAITNLGHDGRNHIWVDQFTILTDLTMISFFLSGISSMQWIETCTNRISEWKINKREWIEEKIEKRREKEIKSRGQHCWF